MSSSHVVVVGAGLGGLAAAIRPQAADVAGLYLVGAGTHPGAGLPGALLSAQITSSLVKRALPPRVERASLEPTGALASWMPRRLGYACPRLSVEDSSPHGTILPNAAPEHLRQLIRSDGVPKIHYSSQAVGLRLDATPTTSVRPRFAA